MPVRIFCVLILGLIQFPLLAVELKIAPKTESSFTMSLQTLERAEFAYDPVRVSSFGLSWGRSFADTVRLGVSQSLNYRNEPYEELRGGDTAISLSLAEGLKRWINWREDVQLGASLSALIGHSKASTDAQKKGEAGASVSISYQPFSFLNLTALAGGTGYFYDRTLSEQGQANPRYAQFAGVSVGARYQQWSLNLGFTSIELIPYEDWTNTYAFSANAGLAYTTKSNYSLALAAQSSNDQLRKGRNQSFRPFDPEVSSYLVSLSKTFERFIF